MNKQFIKSKPDVFENEPSIGPFSFAQCSYDCFSFLKKKHRATNSLHRCHSSRQSLKQVIKQSSVCTYSIIKCFCELWLMSPYLSLFPCSCWISPLAGFIIHRSEKFPERWPPPCGLEKFGEDVNPFVFPPSGPVIPWTCREKSSKQPKGLDKKRGVKRCVTTRALSTCQSSSGVLRQ